MLAPGTFCHKDCVICVPEVIDTSPSNINFSYFSAGSQREELRPGQRAEGGSAYAKAGSSLRKPPVPEQLPPKPESVLCSHLHL